MKSHKNFAELTEAERKDFRDMWIDPTDVTELHTTSNGLQVKTETR